MPNDANMRAQLIAQLFADSAQANMATLAATDTRIVEAADLLIDCLDNGHKVLSCGNGGSAAISNHLTCDHLKGAQTDTDLKPRVVSLAATLVVAGAFTSLTSPKPPSAPTKSLSASAR